MAANTTNRTILNINNNFKVFPVFSLYARLPFFQQKVESVYFVLLPSFRCGEGCPLHSLPSLSNLFFFFFLPSPSLVFILPERCSLLLCQPPFSPGGEGN
eukprot:Lithocolla_globosa_v1_NODE_7571_length_930_cov_3.592000.p1 type:complete len:100 gc:universal NODE_7571_length_930_cov_3.592000:592-891(+)